MTIIVLGSYKKTEKINKKLFFIDKILETIYNNDKQ